MKSLNADKLLHKYLRKKNSWLVSSVDKSAAEVIGFESRTSLSFFFSDFLFTTAKFVSKTAMIFLPSNSCFRSSNI